MGIVHITNGITQDGFGARLQRSLGVLAYTFYLRDKFNIDVKYVHTPFTYEGFGEDYSMGEAARRIGDNQEPYDEITREGYLKRAKLWDDMLSYDGITVEDLELSELTIIDESKMCEYVERDIAAESSNGKLYIVKHLQNEFNSNKIDYDIISKYYSEIKEHFKFIKPIDDDDNIRIHIRRKDAEKFKLERYLDNNYYLSILDIIKPYKDTHNITIHTQRKGFTPTEFVDWDVVYDDEEEDYELFMKMVNSKVLVMGKSSFSLTAGMLNHNIVVYPAQPQKPLSRWINKEELNDRLKDEI